MCSSDLASAAASARSAAQTARNASQSARDAAEGHANRAATSESNAAASESAAKQSEINAGDYAAVATTAATEAVDAMERATEVVGGDFATREYVDTALDTSPRIPRIETIPGYLGVMVDAAGNATDLAIRSSDGQFSEWVVKRLAPRIEAYLETPNAEAPAAPRTLDRFPVMAARLAVNQEEGLPSHFVFCGSSTTANGSPTGYVDRVVKGLQERYPSPLGSETALQTSSLAEWETHQVAGIHGYSAGQGGRNSSTYLTASKVNTISGMDPVAVVHMIGANDYVHSMPPATYGDNVAGWIDQLDAGFTKPVQHILVHTYQRWGPWGGAGAPPNPDHYLYDWDEYGHALAAIAAERTNVGFIDNTPTFRAVGVDASGSDPLDLISTDDVHANPAGYRLLADLILESLRNIS